MSCTLSLKKLSRKYKKLKKEHKSIKLENEKLLNAKVETICSGASQAEFNYLKEKEKHA